MHDAQDIAKAGRDVALPPPSAGRVAPQIIDDAKPPLPSFATLDRSIRAAQARAKQGLSPMAMVAPWADWAFHLARAPGKRMALALRLQVLVWRHALWLARSAAGTRRASSASRAGGPA